MKKRNLQKLLGGKICYVTSLRGKMLGRKRHPNPSTDKSNSTKGGAPTITGWQPSRGVVMDTRLWMRASEREPPKGGRVSSLSELLSVIALGWYAENFSERSSSTVTSFR